VEALLSHHGELGPAMAGKRAARARVGVRSAQRGGVHRGASRGGSGELGVGEEDRAHNRSVLPLVSLVSRGRHSSSWLPKETCVLLE